MADNFNSITFPLEGQKLTFRISYQILTQIRIGTSKATTKKLYSLEFEFRFVENRFLTGLRPTQTTDSSIASKVLPLPKEWPTVQALLEEFKRLVLNKVTPVLGKNVQITGLVLASQTVSISVPIYEFGSGNRNGAPSETSLSFVLQPVLKKGSYRLYVKGGSLDFLKTPLSETDLSTILQFEMLFTAVISMLNENLKLQYVRNNDALISCVFRGPVHFVNKTAKQIKKPGRPRNVARDTRTKAAS